MILIREVKMKFRHAFLSFGVIAALALTAFPQSKSPHAGQRTVQFSHPELVRYDHDGFTVRGKDLFIYSGSFHYFRCDSSSWMDRLEKIKAAGFNTIETYIPWNWHEQTEGSPDFATLENFLSDCEKLGLYVIVRPGPYICAEWDVGGFPEWLAGKGIGFRTASPEDIRWSQYWYNEVLPVIRRHLITNGGSVILVQIENEYDYFDLSDSDKVIYIKSLYKSAMENGIDVPIITCWTRQVRDKTDSVFSQILDACNFYPGWDIENTLRGFENMKSEEPNSPPMVTELQGGWFSSAGDKNIRNADEYGPAQINALTKYVIAHGIKSLNYYMLYGGTNFGYWGSKEKTASYDYTAPISECGGLWEKYRSVKLIGDFIKLAGQYLIHSHEVKDGAECETKGVETLLRSDGSVGFLFVWNKDNKSTNAKVVVKSSQGSPISLSIQMHAKDAYLLPINFPLPDGKKINYSNVQISAITEHNGKPLIIAYGNPGDEAMIYAGSSMCTETVKDADQLFDWDGTYVLLTTPERASRSMIFNTPNTSLVSDSYLTIPEPSDSNNLNLNIQTRPGNDSFSVLGSEKVSAVLIDGKKINTTTTPRTNMVQFSLPTSKLEVANIPISNIRMKPDDEAPDNSGKVEISNDSLPSIDSQGDFQNGYTVYEGEFSLKEDGVLKFNYYDDDWHSVFIDGTKASGLTGNDKEDASKDSISSGTHKVKIFYENEGRPNGDFMEQKKGIESISVFPRGGGIEHLDNWKRAPKFSPYPGENPAEASTSFDDSKWKAIDIGAGTQDFIGENQGWWFRKEINVTESALKENPEIIFKGVDDNALVYVNGKLAVKHEGYGSPFSLLIAGLGAPGENVIAAYIQNIRGPGGIYKPVVLKWGKPERVTENLKFHHSLNGEIARWQDKDFDDSNWKAANHWESFSSGIIWYRGNFTLPSHKGWIIPWRLHIESTGNMQIWLNGRLLGRYFAEGPQKDFYLPDGWLNGAKKNQITFVSRPSGNAAMTPRITAAYVAPYEDYVVQNHTLIINFG